VKTLNLAVFVLAILASVSRADENDNKDDTVEYFRPFPIVGFSIDADENVKAAAREINDIIDAKFVWECKTNPVCCVWIEISRWTPSPGTPGYIIVNQPGGSIITASNAEQLRLAVERFKESIRVNDGEVQIPMGLLTNYSVVVDP
jgi:hypothetical protein